MRQGPGNARPYQELYPHNTQRFSSLRSLPFFYGSPTHNIKGGWWLALDKELSRPSAHNYLRVCRWLGPQKSCLCNETRDLQTTHVTIGSCLESSPTLICVTRNRTKATIASGGTKDQGENKIKQGRSAAARAWHNADGHTRQTGPGISREKPRPLTDS